MYRKMHRKIFKLQNIFSHKKIVQVHPDFSSPKCMLLLKPLYKADRGISQSNPDSQRPRSPLSLGGAVASTEHLSRASCTISALVIQLGYPGVTSFLIWSTYSQISIPHGPIPTRAEQKSRYLKIQKRSKISFEKAGTVDFKHIFRSHSPTPFSNSVDSVARQANPPFVPSIDLHLHWHSSALPIESGRAVSTDNAHKFFPAAADTASVSICIVSGRGAGTWVQGIDRPGPIVSPRCRYQSRGTLIITALKGFSMGENDFQKVGNCSENDGRKGEEKRATIVYSARVCGRWCVRRRIAAGGEMRDEKRRRHFVSSTYTRHDGKETISNCESGKTRH